MVSPLSRDDMIQSVRLSEAVLRGSSQGYKMSDSCRASITICYESYHDAMLCTMLSVSIRKSMTNESAHIA